MYGDLRKEFLKLIDSKEDIDKLFPFELFTLDKKLYYHEGKYGYWFKNKFDEHGNHICLRASNGRWFVRQYDNSELIFHQDSDGNWWSKKLYDFECPYSIPDTIHSEIYSTSRVWVDTNASITLPNGSIIDFKMPDNWEGFQKSTAEPIYLNPFKLDE